MGQVFTVTITEHPLHQKNLLRPHHLQDAAAANLPALHNISNVAWCVPIPGVVAKIQQL